MSRVVHIGNLKIGGDNPIRIKGMLKTPFADKRGMMKEAKLLVDEGVDAIRVAVKRDEDVLMAGYLKKEIKVPIVADIHFHHKLALAAIENGFDAIRLNPMNITDKRKIIQIARAAKKAKVSMRVGVNSGGFKCSGSDDDKLAKLMVDEVAKFIDVLESEKYNAIMVSLKASTVNTTVLANKLFAKRFDYPVHLGVTATGPFLGAVVKSSVGIGILLNEGIGDVIRVSLTAPSYQEIQVAKNILNSLGEYDIVPEIISCPTCSRCSVDLVSLVEKAQLAVSKLDKTSKNLPKKIAFMGCEVNGPGEAMQADVGVAFGEAKGVLFKKGKIVGTVSKNSSVNELLKKMGVK
ncbi:MAG: (E)-4-hydroxy-3-methylbut-2-enyl-diphosphate synthase [Candidatus Omnitrophica bacterium]|nr:(E)-4-hydroxy-3-methylbut-2-enyl-diphosphate synthase [Candidatus Omnitrophota bacterium]MDD5080485.1 (E)-4-hydroxy-3-methylbut-2-enyl-diphosphate synthase [Candidatus Omnitrophota bacterium]MDD5440745.1 (E)-4-hydroxy-3-methylbut-2-enyl-diphosphate synthase [Candidatus Omnitrophota bacterium]